MKQVKVVVDKRTELMGIALRLSKYGEKYPRLMCEVKDWPYMQDVLAYFGKFKNHPAIKTLNQILKNSDFGYEIPLFLALQMDDEYNFHGQTIYPFIDELKVDKQVLTFLQQLKTFEEETKFEEFYNAHKSYYAKQVASFKKQIDTDDVLSWMKEFYNDEFKNKQFIVNLALLFTNGCYGVNVDNKMYHVFSKMINKDGQRQIWGFNYPSERSITLHEFSHSIVNPLLDKYIASVDFSGISEKDLQEKSGGVYGSAYIYIAETIIRALQNLYVTDKGGSTAGLDRANQSCGFDPQVVAAVTAKLDQFRQNPERDFEKSFVDIANVIAKTVNQKIETE